MANTKVKKQAARKTILSRRDQELVDAVILAGCEYMGITREHLLDGYEANTRYACYFLIKEAERMLTPGDIARACKKSRATVAYGIDLMDVHRKIYRQTLDTLNGIAELANKFDKNYSWHIPKISTQP
jgi:hypothetical protein